MKIGSLEIRLHGRGGQGGQVACQMLAAAFFEAGWHVQAFAAYGGERRGAPVTAFLRVADEPIRLRCDIRRASHVVVLDASLLDAVTPDSVHPDALVVVNAAGPVRVAGGLRLVTVDATAIARATGLTPIVGTAMLGAFGAVSEYLRLDDLGAAVAAGSPARVRDNVEACRRAWHETAHAC